MILCMIGGTEIIFIAALVLLLFGGKKIPELMKGVGKGVRSFKDGLNGRDEDAEPESRTEGKDNDEERRPEKNEKAE